jgi:hypothetical protein
MDRQSEILARLPAETPSVAPRPSIPAQSEIPLPRLRDRNDSAPVPRRMPDSIFLTPSSPFRKSGGGAALGPHLSGSLRRPGHPRPQSVDNVRGGNEEVGARRRLAPTGSTVRVKPDGA